MSSGSPKASHKGESVIPLILADHRKVERLFADYHSATNKDTKQTKAWELIKEICEHGAKEEMSIYP